MSHWLSSIDPHAWMLTLPVVLAVLVVAMVPEHSILKRWCRELVQAEAMTWAMLIGPQQEEQPPAPWRQGLLCCVTTALALGTLLSMLRYAGLLG